MEKPIRFRKWATRVRTLWLVLGIIAAWFVYLHRWKAPLAYDWQWVMVDDLAATCPWLAAHRDEAINMLDLLILPAILAWLAFRLNIKGVVVWRVPEATLTYRRSLPWGFGSQVLPLGLTGVRIGAKDSHLGSDEGNMTSIDFIKVRLRILGKRFYPLIEARATEQIEAVLEQLEPLVEHDQ